MKFALLFEMVDDVVDHHYVHVFAGEPDGLNTRRRPF